MNAPVPVSVFILCHNEAANLPRCINAVSRCGDIVVVDDGSSDDSQDVARSLGARVVVHPFTSFADQRNWAMDSAEPKHAWYLHLDADEVATPAMLDELSSRLDRMDSAQVGFYARKVMLNDTWLRRSAGYPVYVPRLVHRDGPRFFMRGHGEWLDADKSNHVLFREPMLHYNFSRGWEDWRARHRRYAAAEARRIADGLPAVTLSGLLNADPVVRRSAIRGLSYRIPGRPYLRFLYSYVLRGGFLDGRPGLEFCLAMKSYEHMIDANVRAFKKAA